MENERQKVEIADIFSRFETDYFQQYDLIREKKKAFIAIINCRSQNMGGHTLKCDTCGYVQHAYNSCRNRNCPKCQYLKQVVWVDKLKARLFPVKYFHIVSLHVLDLPTFLYIYSKIFFSNILFIAVVLAGGVFIAIVTSRHISPR